MDCFWVVRVPGLIFEPMLVRVYCCVLLQKMNNIICCVKNDVVNTCSIDVLTWIA